MAREKVGDTGADEVDQTSSTVESSSTETPPDTPTVPEERPPAKKAARKRAPAKPATRRPRAKPAAATPAAAKPATSKSATDEPVTSKSATGEPVTGTPAENEPATNESATGKAVTRKPATSESAAGRPADRPAAKKPGKKVREPESATARQAAQARSTMQRQHRRIEFWRAAAVGAEAAGAAGLVGSGLLVWEWNDRLWGRTDGLFLAAQVAIAVVVLGLAAAWLLRGDRWRAAARTLAIAAALVVVGLGLASVFGADRGARGHGGLVAAVAAVLVIIGAVGWLLCRRQLRRLFAFGIGYARTGGYGNLPAVRRAQLLGAPAGAIGVAVVVTGALLVAPGLVSTEASTTAEPLALSGEPPVGGEPLWEIEIDGSAGNTTVRATPGGLAVDEVHGMRMVDPANGDTRWYWRDEAYFRAAVAVADEGATIVLGLRYDGELSDRDRLVALDTATGEVRWDRFDHTAVDAMATLGVAPVEGNWLAVPDSLRPSPEAEFDPNAPDTPVGVRLIDLATGETRWRDAGSEGCSLAAIGAGSADMVMIAENCPVPPGVGSGAEACQVSGVSVDGGERMWNWPSEERIDSSQEYASGCRLTALADRVFLSYQPTAFEFDPGAPAAQAPALALDPRTGEEIWAAERDEDSYTPLGVDGLTNPAAVVGDRVVGVEWPSGQPGVGTAALIIRSLADGSRLGEVALPEGQPVGVRAGGDDVVLMSHYSVESDQVKLLEVDLTTAQVANETVVASGSETAQFRSAGLAVGPGIIAIDTLIVPGQEAAPEDVKLVVYGFG